MTLSGENNWHKIPNNSVRIHGFAHLHMRQFFVEKFSTNQGLKKAFTLNGNS